MTKTRLNLSLDVDLVEFARGFAEKNRTTITDVFTQYLLALKRREEGDVGEMIFADPAFRDALLEAQARLKDGSARWRNFDEVLG